MSGFFARGLKMLWPVVIAVLLVSLYTAYLGRELLKAEELPLADFAADLLLERKIDDQGYLLTGHYSRFEFNHPGPFFFYAYHAVHRVLDAWQLPPSAAAYAATMLLNVLFLVIGILLAHRAVGIRAGVLSLLCSVLIVFSMLGHGVHSTWMPYKIITPLFAFFFSLMLVARREFKYLPVSSFLVSVLIHGYLSMVTLALPAFLVAVIVGLRQQESRLTKVEIRYIAAGVLVGAIFFLPMMFDLLFSETSNIGKIVSYLNEEKFRSPRLSQILEGVAEHAFVGLGFIQLSLLLAGTYIFGAERDLAKVWRSGLVVAFLLMATFIGYHKFVPRPILNNMVLFMQAVPMALVTLCVVGFFSAIKTAGWQHGVRRYVVVAGLLLTTYMAGMSLRPAYPGTDPTIRHIAQAVMLATLKAGTAKIDYVENDQWTTTTGVLFELKQQNYPACSTRQEMGFLFTPERICSSDMTANVILMPEAQCNGRCMIAIGGTGIMVPPPPG